MSRLLISNNKNIFSKIKEELNRQFQCLTDVKIGETYIVTYKKLAINNKNTFIVYDKNKKVTSVLTCVGTYFYKELFAVAALEELWKDWKSGCGLKEIKSRSRGCFVVSISDEESTIVFCDDYNLSDCYYVWNQEDREFVISNTWWSIVQVMQQEMDVLPAYEWCQQYAIIDRKTPYKELYRLKGDEYIEFAHNNFLVKKVCLKEREKKLEWTYEVLINNLDQEMKKNVRLVREHFSESALCMTGGLDSRTNLAIMLDQSVRPKLLYWLGDSVMTGTESQDCKIVKEIAEKSNLEAQIVDAKSSHFLDDEIANRKWLFQLGEWYGMFGCNSGIFHMFEDAGDFVEFGVGSNWIKDCELAAFPRIEEAFAGREFINLQTFVDEIYIKEEVQESVQFYEEYRERIYSEFLQVLNEMKIEEDRLSREIVSFLQNEYFRRANCKNYNLANTYVYSFPTLITKTIYRILLDTPYSYRKRNHLVTDLFVRNASKDLVSIAFYSDIRDMKLNPSKLLMEETKKNQFLKFVLQFKHLLGKGKIYEFVKWHFHHINNAKQNDEYCAIDEWILPLTRFILGTEFGGLLNEEAYCGKIHFTPKVDLFFLLYAYVYSRHNED